MSHALSMTCHFRVNLFYFSSVFRLLFDHFIRTQADFHMYYTVVSPLQIGEKIIKKHLITEVKNDSQ